MKVAEPEEDEVESIVGVVEEVEAEADCGGGDGDGDVTTSSSRPIILTKTPLLGTGYEPIWIPRGFSRVWSDVR